MLRVISLTAAQQSALECAGLEDDRSSLVAAAWDRARRRLVVTENTADAIGVELTDLANSEDAQALTQPHDRAAARRACVSLGALALRVRKLGA